MYIGQEQTNYHNHKYNNNNKSLTKKVGESEKKSFFWDGDEEACVGIFRVSDDLYEQQQQRIYRERETRENHGKERERKREGEREREKREEEREGGTFLPSGGE